MKKLKFAHPVKTGGTSIENIGKQNGITWGRFHEEYGSREEKQSQWHEPLCYQHEQLQHKYDWFTIVRDPYERILSHYYCKYGGIGNSPHDTARGMCEYLQKKIHDHYYKQQICHGHPLHALHLYLPSNNVKITILRFENLQDDFNTLMKKYNLPLTLNRHDNSGCKTPYTVDDFSPALILLINTVFAKDFEMFNYKLK